MFLEIKCEIHILKLFESGIISFLEKCQTQSSEVQITSNGFNIYYKLKNVE